MKKKFDSQQALRILRERGIGRYTCIVCSGREFELHNEVTTLNVTDDVSSIRLGTYIPAAALICKNCGNIQLFALGTLGMMNADDGDGE